jgi:glycosyltransferase involved in cell wall biosynthesis
MTSTDEWPQVAVVIPTYERPDRLKATVESVCEQTIDDYEVVVVDDGSSDERQLVVLDSLNDRFDRVRVLRQSNAGPATARNRGWQSTDADIILFTDDDCLVPKDWIESLVYAFEPGVGAVGGPLLPTDAACKRSVFARHHRYRVRKVYDVPKVPRIGGDKLPMGGTANIAYRREALEAVSGFDETFPAAAGEDADLQTRVVRSGYQMKFMPCKVEHNDEYDWSSFRSRAIRHGSGAYYMDRAHGSTRPLWRIIVGLLAAPLFLPLALHTAADPSVAIIAVVERGLARYGEFLAAINDK